MKYQFRSVVFTALVGLFANAVQAVPIVTTAACINDNTKQCATGIADLDILGTLYDVLFNQSSFDDIFPSSDPVFWNDLAGANAAGVAIAAALLNHVIGVPPQNESSYVYIPYSLAPWYPAPEAVNNVRIQGDPDGHWTASGQPTVAFSQDLPLTSSGIAASFATFTPSVVEVPAPATLALTGMGLVAIGIGRRKRGLRRHLTG